MPDTASRSLRQHAPLLLAIATLVLVVVTAMALTSHEMAAVRRGFLPLSRAMSWLEHLDTPFDMDHVVFFTGMTCATRLLLPRLRWWWIGLAVMLFAAGTEIMQFWVPGRTPKLLDARDDMVGGAIGLLMGAVPVLLARYTPWMLGMARLLLLAGVVVLPLQQWSPLQGLGARILMCDLLFAGAVGFRILAWLGGLAPVRMNGFHGWILAYVLAMALACVTAWQGAAHAAYLPFASIGKWIGIVYLASVAILVADLAREEWFMKMLVIAWLAAAIVACLLSIVAIVAFYVAPDTTWVQPLFNYHGSLPAGHYPRVRSLFAYASMFCNFLTVALCMLFAAQAAGWVGVRAFVFAMVCFFIAVAATVTPGLGGISVAVGVWGWWQLHDRWPVKARWVFGAGLLGGLLMLVVTCVSLTAPLDEPSHRWRIWQQAMQTWMEHPWLGIGLKMPVVGIGFIDPSGGHQWLTDAHNTWLSVAGQAGLVGLLALTGLCAWLMLTVWRQYRVDPRANVVLRMSLLAFVCAFLYGGLTASFEDARHLWVLVGMLAAASGRVSWRVAG